MYSPATLTVTANFPAKTLSESSNTARPTPERSAPRTAAQGDVRPLFGEAFDRLTGIKQTHVPFTGYAPAITAVAGGHIEATFIPVGDVHPMVKAGKTEDARRGDAGKTLSPPRCADHEGIGRESGHRQLGGFIAPKGVPEEIIAKLDRAIEKALKSPEVVKSWREMGNVTTYLNHKDFAKWLASHVPETRALVESMGLLVVPAKK